MVSDAHAHLDLKRFDNDREEVIARARSAGLRWIINVCMIGDGAEGALALVEEHDFMRAVAGCHPHDAAGFTERELGRLERMATHPRVVGIGEIGLDFFRDYSPREKQAEAFGAQLDLARRLGLPVIIHDREAHEESLALIRESRVGQGMFHCFSGNVEMAKEVLDLGYYISLPGSVTFPKAETSHAVAAYVPLDRLLVETDCPFITPVPHRGKRNEPAYVVETAKAVARIKGLSYEETAAATTANLERLFGLK